MCQRLVVFFFLLLSGFTNLFCIWFDSVSWDVILAMTIWDCSFCVSWLDFYKILRMVWSSKDRVSNIEFSAEIFLIVSWLIYVFRSSSPMRWSFNGFVNFLDCSRVFACFDVSFEVRCWLGITSSSIFKLVMLG